MYDTPARIRDLHPVFFGAYDWHSAVHGHWTLIRCLQLGTAPDGAEALLIEALTPERLQHEATTIESGLLDGFEIPYGMAWVLMLGRALEEGGRPWMPDAHRATLPLVGAARRRLKMWAGALDLPDETGMHRNTAFALGLLRDCGETWWQDMAAGVIAGWDGAEGRILADEPGPHDFVSPILEVADVMTSLLPARTASGWLRRLLPDAEGQLAALAPVDCPDPSDGRISHLLGLNLSRARALAAIGGRLEDRRLGTVFRQTAARHLDAGMAGLGHDHFSSTHWLATFALRALCPDGGPQPPRDGSTSTNRV